MRPCDISNLLSQLDADELNELDRQTREVVRGVEQTGKTGSVTLKLKLKKSGANKCMVSSELKTQVPRPAPGERTLYIQFDAMNQPTGELKDAPTRQEKLPIDNVTPIKASAKA